MSKRKKVLSRSAFNATLSLGHFRELVQVHVSDDDWIKIIRNMTNAATAGDKSNFRAAELLMKYAFGTPTHAGQVDDKLNPVHLIEFLPTDGPTNDAPERPLHGQIASGTDPRSSE